MIRLLSAALGALQSLVLAVIGLAPGLLLLSLVWAVDFGMAGDWGWSWRAAVLLWLLGHGVPVQIRLDAAWLDGLGLGAEAAEFGVGLAPLGLALLTVLLGVAGGRRLTELAHPGWGFVGGVAAFGLLGPLLAVTAATPELAAQAALAALLPAAWVALGLGIGLAAESGWRLERPQPSGVETLPPRLRGPGAEAAAVVLRAGAAVTAALVAAGALLVLVSLVLGYARVITLYQSLHAGVLGGLAVTLLQAALMPNAAVWGAAWLLGPGFAVGAGSEVGPFGTALGPLPGLPALGALPEQSPSLGFAGLLVPVLAGFLVAAGMRRRLLATGLPGLAEARPGPLLLAGAGIGVVAGLLCGLLAAIAGGAAGPGRLALVGPDPWLTGLAAALLTGVPAALALVTGRRYRGQRS